MKQMISILTRENNRLMANVKKIQKFTKKARAFIMIQYSGIDFGRTGTTS